MCIYINFLEKSDNDYVILHIMFEGIFNKL